MTFIYILYKVCTSKYVLCILCRVSKGYVIHLCTECTSKYVFCTFCRVLIEITSTFIQYKVGTSEYVLHNCAVCPIDISSTYINCTVCTSKYVLCTLCRVSNRYIIYICIIKDTIYKIRNDVCFTGVNNHATFQHFKSTWGQSLYFEANMTIK